MMVWATRLEGPDGDDVFELEDAPQGDQQGQDHGQAGVDGPGHEIGGEDGAVLAGDDGQGEIPGDHAVHRDDQRGGQAGQKEIGPAVMVPLAVGPGPAQREEAVDLAPDPLGPVPHGRQIRDKPGIPEEQADGEIGGDGQHIKDERGLEIRARASAGWDREGSSRRSRPGPGG